MRVELSAPGLSAIPGKPSKLTVKVTNTATVISGHRLRVLGLDPGWVSVDKDHLSLFPDQSGEFVVTITLPTGFPAGQRSLDVEVREQTPPAEVSHNRFELTIPSNPNVKVAIDPSSVNGGNGVSVGVLVENVGNSVVEVPIQGKDNEGKVAFELSPAKPSLAPGERVIASSKLHAKRPWLGTPKIRQFTMLAGEGDQPPTAFGVWVQPPRLSRGTLVLAGLVLAATVFAVVISVTLSRVVSQSNADRDLSLQVIEASQSQPVSGTGAISGVVTLQSTGAPVAAVTVDLYQSSSLSQPVVSTATAINGAYGFSGLSAGTYKVSYTGAGFSQLWYPGVLSASNAGVVTLSNHQNLQNLDIRIGGVPATVSGQVVGTSPAGAVLSLELPPASSSSGTSAPASSGSASGATAPGGASSATAPSGASGATSGGASGASGTSGATSGGATAPSGASGATSSPVTTVPSLTSATSGSNAPVIVATQTLSASGNFVLTNVPSPAVYDLVVTEPGYVTATQEINLAAGDNRSGVTIQLEKGDGSISGTVSAAAGPIGGATISATTGTTTINTVTATTRGKVGSFLLSGLPTPSTLTLVVSAAGYASQTLTVTLAPAQQVTGIAITLLAGEGSISGTVTTPKGAPVGGVVVTASNGSLSVTTDTLSIGAVGSYDLTGLPVPGTYTVTFSRPDLASQTQEVNLATGQTNASDVDVSMVSETASISGLVTDEQGHGTGEVAIGLVSGSNTYQAVTASKPKPGEFEIDGVVPGTYNLTFTRQGGVPTSVIVNLVAGQTLIEHEALTPAASIYGYVSLASTGQPVPSAQVNLYLSSEYPTVIDATTTTNTKGEFTFDNVVAPQGYIVSISYPAGTSPQETALITTALGQASPVCGSNATSTTTTTTSTTSTTTTTTSAGSTAAATESTVTGTASTGTTSLPPLSQMGQSSQSGHTPFVESVNAATSPAALAASTLDATESAKAHSTSCDPETDPLVVSFS